VINPARVQLVEQLLSEKKFSQRVIARLAGVSRGSVGAIAAGRRPDYGNDNPAPDNDHWAPSGPIVRCPRCGGRVFAPCRLCHVRERVEDRPRRSRRLPGR
jgi:hypothetical protein